MASDSARREDHLKKKLSKMDLPFKFCKIGLKNTLFIFGRKNGRLLLFVVCLLFVCCLFVVCLLFVCCLFVVCLLFVCCLFVVCCNFVRFWLTFFLN